MTLVPESELRSRRLKRRSGGDWPDARSYYVRHGLFLVRQAVATAETAPGASAAGGDSTESLVPPLWHTVFGVRNPAVVRTGGTASATLRGGEPMALKCGNIPPWGGCLRFALPPGMPEIFYFTREQPTAFPSGVHVYFVAHCSASRGDDNHNRNDGVGDWSIDACLLALASIEDPQREVDAMSILLAVGDMRLTRLYGEAIATGDPARFKEQARAASQNPALRWLEGYSGYPHLSQEANFADGLLIGPRARV